MLLSGKFAIAIALAMALFQIQCAAWCAEECVSGSHSQQNVPPCHRHQNTPDSPTSQACMHRVDATAILPSDAHASGSIDIDAGVPPCSPIRFALGASFEPIAMTTDSPPGRVGQSATVLRI